jgi:hypothetical protein
MPPPRPVAGQASTEYVALLAVVCVIVAGAAAAVGAPPPLAVKLAAALRHGICRVAGGVCTTGEARAEGLAPCLVAARFNRERLGAHVLVVRVGHGDALLVERRSDGSASVSFADGLSAGLGATLGLRLPEGLQAGGSGSLGAQFTSGRTWEFSSFAAAARFVRRWAPRESLGGELRGALRSACPFCHHHPPAMPEPDAKFVEGGAYGELSAALHAGLRRAGLGGDVEAEAGVVAGRRIARGGRETWYDRLDGEAAGRLGMLLGAVESHSAGTAALEITLDHDRPVELRVRAAARVYDDVELPGPISSLRAVAAQVRGATAPSGGNFGRRLEAEVSLDLTDPRNRSAVSGVVDMMALRVAPGEWDDRLRALAARLDADGAVDVRVLRVGLQERDMGAEGGIGLGAGGSYRSTQEDRRLLRAWSLRAGGPLHEREDCVTA